MFSAVFSLRGDLAGAHVIDLYAGSGALGLEALSRGAASCVFVESDRRAVAAIEANARHLGAPVASVDVVVRSVERVAHAAWTRPAASLLLADPPYRIDPVEFRQVLEALCSNGALESHALVVYEHSADAQVSWPACVCPESEKRYGDTAVSFGSYEGCDRVVTRAICPGSFDPVTNGHLDVIERASALFDEVTVAVALSADKGGGPLFGVEERVAFIEQATASLPNVEVRPFDGLLVECAQEMDAKVIIKGLRAVTDFEREFQMAQLNYRLDKTVETIFIMSIPEYAYLSSSAVKEIARHGGSVKGLVPDAVCEALASRLHQSL